jgi:UTP:GlnB (protein PII) uridylyltransferase
VAAQTACAGLLSRLPLEHVYLAYVAATRHVVGPGTVAAFATLVRGAGLLI